MKRFSRVAVDCVVIPAATAAAAFFAFSALMTPEVAASMRKFQFQRTGSYGATVSWSGVVVEVNENKVSPRFTIQNRVFFSRWKDFHAYAIQACKNSGTGFTPEEPECVEEKGRSLTVPEGTKPFEYSYKFKFKKDGTDMQESFVLIEQTKGPDTEEINWN